MIFNPHSLPPLSISNHKRLTLLLFLSFALLASCYSPDSAHENKSKVHQLVSPRSNSEPKNSHVNSLLKNPYVNSELKNLDLDSEPETTDSNFEPKTPHKDVINRPKTCVHILEDFKKSNPILNAKQAKLRFTLKKDFRSVSKSGAFPSLVLDNQDNKLKFLKIFPKVKRNKTSTKIQKNPSYLEIFFTCRLAQLNLTANLPDNVPASVFFAKHYETGFFKTDDPFATSDKGDEFLYPYSLSEAIENVTLTKLASEPVASAKTIGFDLHSAPPMVIESILLQIIIALKNPHLEWGLTHNDLHTGNILLVKNESTDFTVDFEGKKMKLVGPLVKIIDYGLGRAERRAPKNPWIRNRPFIKELEEFITAVLGKKKISILTRAFIVKASKNQDIRMFNLLLKALKQVLINRGSKVSSRQYCKDYDDCIRLVSSWWK